MSRAHPYRDKVRLPSFRMTLWPSRRFLLLPVAALLIFGVSRLRCVNETLVSETTFTCSKGPPMAGSEIVMEGARVRPRVCTCRVTEPASNRQVSCRDATSALTKLTTTPHGSHEVQVWHDDARLSQTEALSRHTRFMSGEPNAPAPNFVVRRVDPATESRVWPYALLAVLALLLLAPTRFVRLHIDLEANVVTVRDVSLFRRAREQEHSWLGVVGVESTPAGVALVLHDGAHVTLLADAAISPAIRGRVVRRLSKLVTRAHAAAGNASRETSGLPG